MKSTIFCLLSIVGVAVGGPVSTSGISRTNTNSNNTKYSLPQNDPHPAQRRAEIERNRFGFLYGPPLLGNTSYFPAGKLGEALVKHDIQIFGAAAAPVDDAADLEANQTFTAFLEVCQVSRLWTKLIDYLERSNIEKS